VLTSIAGSLALALTTGIPLRQINDTAAIKLTNGSG
jgi:hypothetical protein